MIGQRIRLLKRIARQQSGQVFIMVLLVMLLGGLVIPPLLAYTGTGIKTGQVYERKSNELYSADAGIEDGIWQVKYYDMEQDPAGRFPSYNPYAYYEHNAAYSWPYDLTAPGVNSQTVHVKVENEWIPKGITVPGKTEANAVVSASNFIVAGSVSGQNTYRIRITYTKTEMADNGPAITSIGVWLPPGYQYVAGSSNLEHLYPTGALHPTVVITSPYKGGQAVEWNFSSSPLLYTFSPGTTGDQPIIREVTFQFTGSGTPTAQSWVKTGTCPYIPYSYTWDADIKVYKITATAGSATLESHVAKTELRHLGGAIAGDYYATGNSLIGGNPSYRDELHQDSSTTVAQGAIPPSARIEAAYLYWSGWIDWHGFQPLTGGDTVVFTENCNNFATPPVSWSQGGRWTIYNNDEFRNQGGGTQGQMTLSMSQSLNLAAYASKTATISWSQRKTGTLEDSDYLYFAFSADGGTTWGGNIEAFHGNSPAATFSYIIPAQYLTSGFRMRFYSTLNASDEYAYINNITITVSNAIFSDNCADFNSPPMTWTHSADWTISSGAFPGHYSSGNRYVTMGSSLDLSSHADETVTVSWQQWEGGDLESSDRLWFSFSGNGGSTWSSDILAFQDDIGSTPQTFPAYTIPSQYLTNNFRMRFYLDSFSDSGEYAYIDNLLITKEVGSLAYPTNPTPEKLTTLVEQTARVNKVKFGATVGDTTAITADEWHILESTNPQGQSMFDGQWAYSCYKDVTDLVHQWTQAGDITTNGLGTYTLGHVVAVNEDDPTYSFNFISGGQATGYPLGTPAQDHSTGRYQACYAGWSLILIYTSPETKGHQLFLYDNFMYAWHSDPDFDNDGHPGGTIGGFLVPDRDPDETIVAQVTAFVGEGDSSLSGDYFKVNGSSLSNSASPSGNVWNSNSPGLAIPGIDIDTFSIPWQSNILMPGDTEADVNLPTVDDGFNAIYIILSFRSSTTTGGTLGYLIK